MNFHYDLPLSQNVHAGCARQDVCLNHGCKHGTCVDLWNRYECQCILGYTSPFCEIQTSMSFDALGNSSVEYTAQQPITSVALQFNIKPSSEPGVMLYTRIVVSS